MFTMPLFSTVAARATMSGIVVADADSNMALTPKVTGARICPHVKLSVRSVAGYPPWEYKTTRPAVCATLRLAAPAAGREPVYVQRRLWHASIKLTVDTRGKRLPVQHGGRGLPQRRHSGSKW
jgi:hypothetical protein